METISIISYKQPVTRGDIEDIRGVSISTQSIRSLLERNWIKVTGNVAAGAFFLMDFRMFFRKCF